ncbi:hypothetical protein LZ554_006309 [Drepanopeziza brunnea f. sp. 'monogermtubi']|nr:hypothetical protein LZ554_006309 [Drepanopeziza brunnea f. sp. 'monogermtubi']
MRSTMLRQIFLAPPAMRNSIVSAPPRMMPNLSFSRQYSMLPSVIQKDFWLGMIPKPLRKSSPSAALKKKVRSKEWNPATFFIAIFLLIGSMSIQMIALRNEFAAFSRRADARIGLLKEIIERIQKGEDVDVEGLLGTGDAVREREWEEVLQEIEREDEAWEKSRKSKPKHGRNLEDANAATAKPHITEAQPVEKPKSNAPSGFY